MDQKAQCRHLYDKTESLSVMLTSTSFSDMLYCLHPFVLILGQVLEEIRKVLTHRYHKAERHIAAIDRKVSDRLHKRFVQAFLGIIKGLDIEVGPQYGVTKGSLTLKGLG